MNKVRSIFTNSILLVVGRVVVMVLSVFVSIRTVRYLGAIEYGELSIIFAYLSFFQILASFGIDSIVIREMAKYPDKQPIMIYNAVVMKLVFSLFAIIASWTVLQFMGYPQNVKMYIYIASFAFIFGFGSIYAGFFQIHLKVQYYVVTEILTNAFFSSLILVSITMQLPMIYIVVFQASMVVPTSVINAYFSKKIGDYKLFLFRIDFSLWKWFLRESWPLFLGSIFVSINSRIDQILLFKFLGARELGIYSAIVKLTESLNFIPSLFMSVLFPILAASFVQSQDRFAGIYNLSFRYMSAFIIPVAFGSTLLSGKIIGVVYGQEFLRASTAFTFLIWSSIFVFLGVVNANVLTAAGLQKHVFAYTLSGGVMNILLNIILIPKYGILGAAIATFISYGANPNTLIQYCIVETRHIAERYIVSMIKPIICSTAMLVFLYFINIENLYFTILTGFISYTLFMVMIQGFNNEDLRYLRQLVRYRKTML